MRLLTVFAGIIYVAAGALCFLFTEYSFASLAFPVGVLIVMAGLCVTAAFIASGKKNRVPDTVLVEGLVDMMFGFAVLNNQVSDAMLSMFFGSFTCIAGATRLSQSLDVSRYRPKDWARVMPLSAITAMLGVVMMMPRLMLAAPTKTVVGAAFIINGFSMIIYSMYMEKRTAAQRNEDARNRTIAKKAAAEAKRKQRDMLRSLSRKEREAAKAKIKEERKNAKQAKKEAMRLEMELSRMQRRTTMDDTIPFSKDDAEEVRRIADKLGVSDEAVIQAAVEKVAARDPQPDDGGTAEGSEGPEVLTPADLNKYPTWQKPSDIPSLRSAALSPASGPQETEQPGLVLSAVNLDDLENVPVALEFESPELPPVELISETAGPVDRKDILRELEKPIEQDSVFTDYVPLRVEELIDERLEIRSIDDPDDSRFTRRMSFTWGARPEIDEESQGRFC